MYVLIVTIVTVGAGEEFPAVASAEKAVAMAPQWSAAWQTLGRTQLNIGEVEMVREWGSQCVCLLCVMCACYDLYG